VLLLLALALALALVLELLLQEDAASWAERKSSER
jgi:hypothetical protein